MTLYGPDGEALAYPSNRERGIADIHVQQTATTAPPAAVWAIRSITATRVIYVRKFWLQLATASARPRSNREVRNRFSTEV